MAREFPRRLLPRLLWPASLAGQLLLVIALTLLVAQTFNAVLLYRGQANQRAERVATALALRLVPASQWAAETDDLDGALEARQDRRERRRQRALERGEAGPERFRRDGPGRFGPGIRGNRRGGDLPRRLRIEDANPVAATERRLEPVRLRLTEILESYGLNAQTLDVGLIRRPLTPMEQRRLAARSALPEMDGQVGEVAVAALQLDNGRWLVIEIPAPPAPRGVIGWLIFQTIMLYIALMVPIIWLTRRLSRPLKALTHGVEQFRDRQNFAPVAASGPADVTALIAAFNAMGGRISAMLEEKDVMLGAIGHDLKTPLAALRVRIESVENDSERELMVASISDITQTLDDILALARIGKPLGEREPVNLTALIETIVDEYQDMDKPVTMADSARLVLPCHVTWMRRALRNLIDNALRYGHVARVTLIDNGTSLTVRVADDGPGIPEDQIAAMFEPFARLDTSRNTATGGAGLGLTLTRAIIDQHDGELALHNRRPTDGESIVGLDAVITLPKS